MEYDREWIKKVATQLAPIFMFMGHEWGDVTPKGMIKGDPEVPDALRIENAIIEMIETYEEDEMYQEAHQIYCGGLTIWMPDGTEENRSMSIHYTREIVFEGDQVIHL